MQPMNGEIAPASMRDQLAAWRTERNMSMAAVAKRAGVNEATISRYLASTMTGDVAGLEAKLRDMMLADARRQTWAETYIETQGCAETMTVLELIRGACDIGLVTGPAGIGKTTACRRYAAESDTSILITLSEGSGDSWSIIRLIFGQLDMRAWSRRKGGETRSDAVVSRLSGSERLIIVDNAQRATLSGLRWLFDLADQSGVPVALVGNPDVLTRVAGSDQLHSRIGLRADIGARRDMAWLDSASSEILAAMWPAAPAEVRLLAQETARQPGHLRRLVKQLRIAIRLSESAAWRKSQAAAFVEARTLIGATTEED
jgi:DNA transposition AAA+ family ATPase